MRFRYMIIGLFGLFCNMGYAQFSSFSTDPEKFFEQSKDWLATVDKSDAKKFMDEFENAAT